MKSFFSLLLTAILVFSISCKPINSPDDDSLTNDSTSIPVDSIATPGDTTTVETPNPLLAHLYGTWIYKSSSEYYSFLENGEGYRLVYAKNDGKYYHAFTWTLQDSLLNITYFEDKYFNAASNDYQIAICNADTLKYSNDKFTYMLRRLNTNSTTGIDYHNPPYVNYLRVNGVYYPLCSAVMRCDHAIGTNANMKYLFFYGTNNLLQPTGAYFMYSTPYYEGINREWADGSYTIQSQSGFWIYGGCYTYNSYMSNRCDGQLTIKTVGQVKYFDFTLNGNVFGHFEGTID